MKTNIRWIVVASGVLEEEIDHKIRAINRDLSVEDLFVEYVHYKNTLSHQEMKL